MCTAISMKIKDSYFGRNLDYEHTFGEKIAITPRNYRFDFSDGSSVQSHHAIIGMAVVYENYPLYFDAVNEAGLGMAGLNFPKNACYNKIADGKENTASFEFIPKILSRCKDITEAKEIIENTNITDSSFKENMPPTPLHWLISNGERSITVEQTKDGIMVYDNPVGVLTNSPTFDVHMANLSNYMHLSPYEPKCVFSDRINLKAHSRGMGAVGLPGDLSSMSRFVKATFTKLNLVCEDDEGSAVCGFFHALYSVYQQNGCVRLDTGLEKTNYSCCCNMTKGIYYYTTYNNPQICAVDMHMEKLDGNSLSVYNLADETHFVFCN